MLQGSDSLAEFISYLGRINHDDILGVAGERFSNPGTITNIMHRDNKTGKIIPAGMRLMESDMMECDIVDECFFGGYTEHFRTNPFNEYLCDRIVYDGKTYVGINEIFTSPSPVNGSCGAFADALNYLCGKAGIPCISVHGESHFWNAVYCDGAWSYVDVSLNDQVSNHAYLLFADSTKKQSSDPEAVAFLKELLVPGSTR